MTVVGVTGHRELRHPDVVRRELDDVLGELDPPIVGVTALAAGADQLFAAAVLAAGGSLEVIVPSADYLASLPEDARDTFEFYESRASRITVLDFDEAGSDAYVAAGLAILDRCDVLVAVWDGGESRGSGGTADIVARARDRGIPVRIIDGPRG